MGPKHTKECSLECLSARNTSMGTGNPSEKDQDGKRETLQS